LNPISYARGDWHTRESEGSERDLKPKSDNVRRIAAAQLSSFGAVQALKVGFYFTPLTAGQLITSFFLT
jgi:hypothetical protein